MLPAVSYWLMFMPKDCADYAVELEHKLRQQGIPCWIVSLVNKYGETHNVVVADLTKQFPNHDWTITKVVKKQFI